MNIFNYCVPETERRRQATAREHVEICQWLDLAGTNFGMVPLAIGFGGNRTVSSGEVVPFILADKALSSTMNVGCLTVADGAVFALNWQPQIGNTLRLFRLDDQNGPGLIDQAGEVSEVWNSLTLPPGTEAQSA